MNLSAADGSTFTLRILGYQFPELDAEPYDSNWLNIKIHVRVPAGAWSATTACLLTYEISELADWLEAMQEGRPAEDFWDFTEPNLQFALVVAPGQQPRLRIAFALECRPPWARGWAFGTPVWAEFPLAEVDLRRAANALRSQLQTYPQRTVY